MQYNPAEKQVTYAIPLQYYTDEDFTNGTEIAYRCPVCNYQGTVVTSALQYFKCPKCNQYLIL